MFSSHGNSLKICWPAEIWGVETGQETVPAAADGVGARGDLQAAQGRLLRHDEGAADRLPRATLYRDQA